MLSSFSFSNVTFPMPAPVPYLLFQLLHPVGFFRSLDPHDFMPKALLWHISWIQVRDRCPMPVMPYFFS